VILGGDTIESNDSEIEFITDAKKNVISGLIGSRSRTPVKVKRMTKILGVGPRATVSAFNNSFKNFLQSVKCRVFMYKDESGTWISKDSHPHDDLVFEKLLSEEFSFLTKNNTSHTPIPVTEYHKLYSGLKKRRYLKAGLSLLSSRLRKRDWRIKMFIKFEKDIRSAKPDHVPRTISPPGDRMLVSDGSYSKAAEHSVFKKVNEMYGHIVVAKGLNYQELGILSFSHWKAFNNPVSVDLDVKRLDQSISQIGLHQTHLVLCSFFGPEHADRIIWLFSKQLTTHAKAKCDDGELEYWVEGTLTSGQTNTSMVGVLLVTCILHGYFRTIGVNIRLLNCGDDCTIICEEGDMSKVIGGLKSWFSKFAMRIKLSGVNKVFEGIEFCQTRPVWTPGGYQMVRNVRDAIIKDSVCIDPLDNPVKAAKWLNAVASGGINTHGGIPIFQDFYTCYARSSDEMLSQLKLTKRQRKRVSNKDIRSVEKSSMSYWGKGMMKCYEDNIHHLTRLSFYKAFGITPVQQCLLEGYYRSHLVLYNDLKLYFNEDTTCSNMWY